MLPGHPVEGGGDRDAGEPVVFHEYLGALAAPVLDVGTEPGIDQAGNVHGRCCDEVVPG